MKIILVPNGFESKILLENGMDITKEMNINSIEIKASANGITTAILTVYPSEVYVEVDEKHIEFVKHPDWEAFKK